MTAMTINFNGAAYTLTTEHSASSYGIPVLVAEDGTAFAAGEAVTALPAEVPAGTDWFSGMFAAPERVLTARDVVNAGEHSATNGETFRAPAEWDATYMTLTDYGRATADMVARFIR